MYLPLIVTEPGNITFVVSEGAVVEAGTTVATMQLADPSKVRKADLYDGDLPNFKPPLLVDVKKPHHVFM